MTFWPPQTKLEDGILAAIRQGYKRILGVLPTRAGKTKVMASLANRYLLRNEKVALYLNRKLLIEQMAKKMNEYGLYHGVRAADYDDERRMPFQICSIQTEGSRTLRKQGQHSWDLHEAKLVLIDEGHLCRGKDYRAVADQHVEDGAVVIYFTATPLDMEDVADLMVIGGSNTDARACGAIVPCLHYGPDEPDLRCIGKIKVGEDLSENQNRKAMMREGVFGRVLKHYRELNPQQKPAIGFAPGVKESLGFAQEFQRAGIPAAHIDGDEIWMKGEWHKSEKKARMELEAALECGDIKIVWNRFVLREGIDWNFFCHAILATAFGSLQSYIQSGGRILGKYPGKDSVVIQDHGGNWHRHGSLNADRHWKLSDTASGLAQLREERFRCGEEKEPRRCPQCSRIVNGPKCFCGEEFHGRYSRPVVQSDGQLVLVEGDVFKPRKTAKPDAEEWMVKDWKKTYWQFRNSKENKKTFKDAANYYASKHYGVWPSTLWPFMPREAADWLRYVCDVEMHRLRPDPNYKPKERR